MAIPYTKPLALSRANARAKAIHQNSARRDNRAIYEGVCMSQTQAYDIGHRMHKWLVSAAQFEATWRADNILNFDFYDGEQWDSEAKAVVEARGQLAANLNICRPIIDLVMALEAQRRSDLILVGREDSDDLVSGLLTHLYKQVEDLSDFPYYISQVFRDAIIGGRGCFGLDVQKDAAGRDCVHLLREPWEDIFVDPYSRLPCAQDARFIFKRTWMDRDMVKARWPGDKASLVQSVFDQDAYQGQEYEARITSPDRGFNVPYYEPTTDRVALYECWYLDAKRIRRHAIFSDTIFLEGSPDNDEQNESPYKHNVQPLIPVYAFRTRKGAPQGMVAMLKDYQRTINKLSSKYLWCMSANRLMIEQAAVDDIEILRGEWNRPDGIVVFNDNGLQHKEVDNNLKEAAYLVEYLKFQLSMAQRTSGINDSVMGFGGTNERSNVQQVQRISQGDAMQTGLFDNLLHARKQVCRNAILLIGQYYTDKRIVRVTQPNGLSEAFELNRQEAVLTPDGKEKTVLHNSIQDILAYDVVLKPIAPFNSVRQEQMRIWAEVLKTGVIPPEISAEIILQLSDLENRRDILYRLQKMQDATKQEAMATQQTQLQAQAQGQARKGAA